MCWSARCLRRQKIGPGLRRHRRQELCARRFARRHVQVSIASVWVVWCNWWSVVISVSSRSRRSWRFDLLLSLGQVAHQLLPELVNVEVWALSSNKLALQSFIVRTKLCNLCSHLVDNSFQFGHTALLVDLRLVLDGLGSLTETQCWDGLFQVELHGKVSTCSERKGIYLQREENKQWLKSSLRCLRATLAKWRSTCCHDKARDLS